MPVLQKTGCGKTVKERAEGQKPAIELKTSVKNLGKIRLSIICHCRYWAAFLASWVPTVPKTTTIKMMLGLMRLTEGKARAGQDIVRESEVFAGKPAVAEIQEMYRYGGAEIISL